MGLNLKKIKPLVRMALDEDVGKGDATTRALIPREAKAKATIRAKEPGVIAGLKVAELVFNTVNRQIRFVAKLKDGERVKKGQLIAEVRGSARGILTAERTALNFLQHLSGIATLTRKYVEAVKPYKAKIYDTRKTTPGWRILEKYAVKVGGGENHRMGLWDAVLIKKNHIKVFSQVGKSKSRNIKELINLIKEKVRGMKIEVEIGNLRQFREAIEAGTDIIMLDNMSLAQMRKALEFIRDKTFLEASGRITLKNVREVAKTGVDMVSIGEITHSAPALDISLEI